MFAYFNFNTLKQKIKFMSLFMCILKKHLKVLKIVYALIKNNIASS